MHHDSLSIANMFTANATVVFSDQKSIQGSDSTIDNWINKNLSAAAHLSTEKIASSSSADMAYDILIKPHHSGDDAEIRVSAYFHASSNCF